MYSNTTVPTRYVKVSMLPPGKFFGSVEFDPLLYGVLSYCYLPKILIIIPKKISQIKNERQPPPPQSLQIHAFL